MQSFKVHTQFFLCPENEFIDEENIYGNACHFKNERFSRFKVQTKAAPPPSKAEEKARYAEYFVCV